MRKLGYQEMKTHIFKSTELVGVQERVDTTWGSPDLRGKQQLATGRWEMEDEADPEKRIGAVSEPKKDTKTEMLEGTCHPPKTGVPGCPFVFVLGGAERGLPGNPRRRGTALLKEQELRWNPGERKCRGRIRRERVSKREEGCQKRATVSKFAAH